MPITVKFNLYTLAEIFKRGGRAADKARQCVLENVESQCYEHLIHAWKDYLTDQCGMDDVEINFTGFWSQGDGACFHGQVVNFRKFMEGFSVVNASELSAKDAEMFGLDLVSQYPHLYKVLSSEDADTFGIFDLRIVHIGNRYYHEYSVSFDWLDSGPTIQNLDLAFVKQEITQEQHDLFKLATKDYDALVSKDGLEKSLRDVMKQMYYQLQAEYEWYTSDEQLIETADVNDWVFFEDGRFAGSRKDHECVSKSSDVSAATTNGSGVSAPGA